MLENLCPSSNGLDQFASLQLVAPPEELVCVHTVGSATCATLAPGSNVSSANRQVIFDEDADGWLDAYSVDHGHLFGGPMADLKRHFRASCYLDRRIYGQVPPEALLDFQNALHALDADRLRQRIEAIPAEWSHASARKSFECCLQKLKMASHVQHAIDEITDDIERRTETESGIV
jgi:hypothetical protein